MSLIDDFKAGYEAASWGSAPIYPNAVWPAKVVFDTDSIDGLEFSIYARDNKRSSERLFDIDFIDEVEEGKVVLYPLAVNDDTGEAFLNPTLWITCEFKVTTGEGVEGSGFGNVYIVAEGDVPVGVGSIPAVEA